MTIVIVKISIAQVKIAVNLPIFAFLKEPNKDDNVPTLIEGPCFCSAFVGLVKDVLVSCANFFASTLFLGREGR